ncbi:hypothetical protein FIBSPDRAFT_961214 [Athelia psychrophila]|uniref:F-box domain-containing protein n=1 Tax=Athelia psychrophila TaxID=1759441 RepID=A0A166BGW3_9AGAM|nr:hypothetical protein FIBSPDRAFT_961214 [Fibularhizoctonia sp. CBS 109695]
MPTVQLPPKLWHHIFDIALQAALSRTPWNPSDLRILSPPFRGTCSNGSYPAPVHLRHSATLRTLTIEVINANLGSFLGAVTRTPVALPALAELSLTYNSPYENPLRHFVNSLLVHPCPTLRCLDVSGLVARQHGAALQLCARLGEIAPRLTHLRIPARMALDMVRVMHPRDDDTVPQVQCLPSSIRRVLVPLREQDTSALRLHTHECRCIRCDILFAAGWTTASSFSKSFPIRGSDRRLPVWNAGGGGGEDAGMSAIKWRDDDTHSNSSQHNDGPHPHPHPPQKIPAW